VVGTPVESAASPILGTQVTATATCAVGKVLLGGGARITTSGPTGAVVNSSYPSSTTVWTAVGEVTTAFTLENTFTVTAYALCSE
jgi:hypothetical protein